jgi:hypothetical protein
MQHRALALGVAAVLFAGVFAIRVSSADPVQAYSMFYVFPIALVATTFGLRAGAASGAFGVLLVVVWAIVDDVGLSVMGWASRAVPLLLLGVLIGEASDRFRRAEAQRHALEAAALLHREAIEINDSLVQGMAAAKWALEAGNLEAGSRLLDDTIARAHGLVSDLIRRAEMRGRAQPLPGTDGVVTGSE